MNLVEELRQLDPDDLPKAGGKAANLGVLIRAGLPVPPGFCLMTPAYRRFVDNTGLTHLISQALKDVDPADSGSLETASSMIRKGFGARTLPADVAREVKAAHVRLLAGHPPGQRGVAVRSSATAEDLPGLSFAGQQDTFLNVVGPEALLDAVLRCWASLWTARAIGYRIRNGVDNANVSMAVVVQSMVVAEAAGVLFTADPLTGRRTRTVIDATVGLGEALVSGAVEPDHYVVDPATGRIIDKTVGAKAVSVRGLVDGGTVVQVETDTGRQALSDEQILAVARLGRRAEEVFGTPQDLEWVWSGKELSVVQSRPITSLYPLPDGVPDHPVTALFAFAVWQGVLDPFTPLGRDMFAQLAAGMGDFLGARDDAVRRRVLLTAGERLFVDIGPLLRTARGRSLARGALSVIDPASAAALDDVLADPRFAVRPVAGPVGVRAVEPRLTRAAARLIAHVVRNLVWPARGRARLEATIATALRTTRRDCEGARDLAALVATIRRRTRGMPPRMVPYLVGGVVAGQAPHQALLRTVDDEDGRELVMELSRGLPHNVTTRMDLDLWQAVTVIREDAVSRARVSEGPVEAVAEDYRRGWLPAPAQRALEDFLARYGARGIAEVDLGRVRWGRIPAL